MKVPVYSLDGEVVEQIELSEAIFAIRFNRAVVHQAMVRQLANGRQGTASTKTRAEVSGSTRKLYAQKHTGRARRGDIKSPLLRGGGVTFGPRPRNFKYKLPHRMRKIALVQSLNSKIKDNEIIVIDRIGLDEPKTKKIASMLSALKSNGKSLIVMDKSSPQITRASRNIPGVTVKTFNNINAYDVLQHKKVVFTRQAIENLVKLRKR